MEQGTESRRRCEEAAFVRKRWRAYGRIFDENCTYHVIPYRGDRETALQAERVRT